MEHIYVCLALLGSLTLGQMQDGILRGTARRSDKHTKPHGSGLSQSQSHRKSEQSREQHPPFGRLEDAQTELTVIRDMSMKAVPVLEKMRRELLSNRDTGPGVVLDKVLRTCRDSILQVLAVLRAGIPEAKPIFDFIERIVRRIFG